MSLILTLLCVLIALEHVGFLVLEMFLWRKPYGLKTFGMTPQVAESSAALAANQGLYNGFLAAGLVWSLLASDSMGMQLKLFFLGCVLVAGIYGGFTAKRSILIVQALPAAIGLGLLGLMWR
jgi:putative membrane protein